MKTDPHTAIAFLLLFVAYSFFAGCEDSKPAETASKPPTAETWDGTSSLLCGSNQVVTVKGVTSQLLGDVAVIAKENCQLTLLDCTIDAGIGIQAVGNAKVRMEGGSLTGSEAAVDARSLAEVSLIGVEVAGKRNSVGSARISERKGK